MKIQKFGFSKKIIIALVIFACFVLFFNFFFLDNTSEGFFTTFNFDSILPRKVKNRIRREKN